MTGVFAHDTDVEDDGQPTFDMDDGQSTFECGCCFDDYPIGDSIPCNEGHLFCQECLKRYVESILFDAGKSSPICLTLDCGAPFLINDLRFLDPKLIEGLEGREQKEMLATTFGQAKDEQLHQCPFCNFTCLIPGSIQVFRCFKCQKESCKYCRIDWKRHKEYGYICDEVEEDEESNLRLKMEEAMTDNK